MDATWIRRCLRVAAVIAAMPICGHAQDTVELEVRESAGVDRIAEPVTTGIPFAAGAVPDAAALAVTDAGGTPIPAQFRAISSWPDGSVRWALMDCQVDVQARGHATLIVGRGACPAPDAPVAIEEGEDSLSLSTGPLEFTVSKTRFDVFDSLRVHGTEVVAPGSPGLVLYTAAGAVTARTPPREVVVEERGPMRAVVRVRGTYPGVHDGLLRYTVRLIAWAGKSYVGVRVWLENDGRYGYVEAPEWYEFDGQAVELDLGLGAIEELQVDGHPVPAHDAPGHGLRVAQHNPSEAWSGFEYSIARNGERVERGTRTSGLVSLSGAHGSLTVGVRYFWENFPKAIELDGSRLRIWLWPTDGEWPPVAGRWSNRGAGDFAELRKAGVYQLPGCVRKGHEIILDFSGRHPAATQATLRAPLMAMATPEHYAATEATPGWFAPAEFRTGDRSYDGVVAYWNRQAYDAVDLRSRTSIWSARTGVRSAVSNWYGWMNFGDNGWGGGFSALHYDWTWIVLLNYLRQGHREFFDMGVTMARHLIEVDHLWSERNHPMLQGMARYEYSNPYIHGGVGDGYCKPNPTHNWISGIVLYYMLTGDPIARECALSTDRGLERRCVDRYRENPRSGGQARETGWAILSYCSLYDLSGDARYLDKAMVLFRNHQKLKWQESGPHTDGGLQYYYSIQGLCELQWRTGDPEVLQMLEDGCAEPFTDRNREWPVFLSNLYAYVGHVKGRPEYLARAKQLFAAYRPQGSPACYTGSGAWDKETGKYLRNGHILQYALWRASR